MQPRVVSITQATELGTVYTLSETRAIADAAHALDIHLHVDGARLANAAVSLGASLREVTTDAGVDAVSFGGTKNGLVWRGGGGVHSVRSSPSRSSTPASSSGSSPPRCASSRHSSTPS